MKEILKFIKKPICIGDVVTTEYEGGFKLQVGREGGSIKFVGEKGSLGGYVWSEDKHIVLPFRYDTVHSY